MVPSSLELIYFAEVAREMNLSRAAKNLFISQPSLSLAIQRLEKIVGTQLLIRHKKGVSMTPAGKKILAQVNLLLQQWENTKLEAMSSHQHVEGIVRIGCHATLAVFFDELLAKMLKTYPKLQIHFKHELSIKTIESVLDLTIDVGLVFNPPPHPELVIHTFNQTELAIWKGPGCSSIQDIRSSDVVVICNPDIPQTHTLLAKAKLSSARILRSSSMEAITDFTATGCGVGILCSSFVYHAYPDLLERIPDMPSLFIDACMAYRQESRNIKAIQTVITAMREYVATKRGKVGCEKRWT